jgi:hypothetical protein
MQREPIAINAPPSGRVSGLGVCDALRLELEPAQVPWLVDELDVMRGPLEEQFLRTSADDREQLDALGRELDLLRLMRAQLPGTQHGERLTFVGPAGRVCRIADAVLANAVAALAEHVREGPPRSEDARAWLREIVAVVAAWAQTVADCYAVEAYSFDPRADPAAPS